MSGSSLESQGAACAKAQRPSKRGQWRNWKKTIVTQKARGMVWGEAEKVGKGLTTQGLWLTCTFCSFLRMQGSFWVLNKRMMC